MNNIPFVNLERPKKLENKIKIAINNVIKNNKFILGPEVFELENKLKKYCGSTYAVTCSSGTDALLMTLMALGVKPNDAIFLPSFTFIATAEAIVLSGCQPVFIDVLDDTFNIDPESFKLGINIAIKNKLIPKYVIIVDLFGQPADFNNIKTISEKYNIKIIIDAAQSFGAKYNNKKVGSFGLVTTTSFYPTKPFGCFGDGGCIFTNNKNIAKTLLSIRNHGQGLNKYKNIRIGLNARLDTIQAAILLEKLNFLDKENLIRDEIASCYNKILSKKVIIPFVKENVKNIWAQYTIKLKNENIRNIIIDFLKKENISTEIYYIIPIHLQKAYKKYLKASKRLIISEKLSKTLLSLPIYPYMTSNIKTKIMKTLKNMIKII